MILLSRIKVGALYGAPTVGHWLAIKSLKAIKSELNRWEAMQ